MSFFAAALILAGSGSTDNLIASGQLLPISEERLIDCVLFHSGRSADGEYDGNDLVQAARANCEIPIGMWRFFLQSLLETQKTKEEAIEEVGRAENKLFRDLARRVNVQLKAERDQSD